MLVVAVGAGSDGCHPLVDQGRRVGHDPHHGHALGYPGLDEGRRDAGGQGDEELTRLQLARNLGEQVVHVLGLDHHGDGLGLARGLDVGADGDAVPLLELSCPLWPLLADQQVVDATTRANQAGEKCLPHHPGSEDGCLAHRPAPFGIARYFLEISDLAKNDRFCGRSARRRMR
jgi:hypothetical protein